ncbi:MAG: helix-turn-helix domain-containing protein [Oscillospiraceae bacterium]|nr:helix-turn-helix domain-containing protein [Oscillospiraceae bacterium]
MGKLVKIEKAKLKMQTLKSASKGETDAMSLVLKNYEGYINALATVRLYDEQGKTYLFTDDTLKKELEMLLMVTVMKYKPRKNKSA